MSKVPVLVTGGAGYIGSHAVLALKDAGWPVAVIDDLSNGTRHVVPEGVPFFEGNIADRTLVNRIFKDQQIGAIMHFAGSIVVPESVEKPLDYYRNNTIASHSLISAAVAAVSVNLLRILDLHFADAAEPRFRPGFGVATRDCGDVAGVPFATNT